MDSVPLNEEDLKGASDVFAERETLNARIGGSVDVSQVKDDCLAEFGQRRREMTPVGGRFDLRQHGH